MNLNQWCNAYESEPDSVDDLPTPAFPTSELELHRALSLLIADERPPDVSYLAPRFLYTTFATPDLKLLAEWGATDSFFDALISYGERWRNVSPSHEAWRIVLGFGDQRALQRLGPWLADVLQLTKHGDPHRLIDEIPRNQNGLSLLNLLLEFPKNQSVKALYWEDFHVDAMCAIARLCTTLSSRERVTIPGEIGAEIDCLLSGTRVDGLSPSAEVELRAMRDLIPSKDPIQLMVDDHVITITFIENDAEFVLSLQNRDWFKEQLELTQNIWTFQRVSAEMNHDRFTFFQGGSEWEPAVNLMNSRSAEPKAGTYHIALNAEQLAALYQMM